MVALRNETIGAPTCARALPVRNSGAMNLDKTGDNTGSAKFRDDCLCWLHKSYCSDLRYKSKGARSEKSDRQAVA
jgi:hypothetical protein